MDKDTRNLLFNTTQAIRRLLEEEFSLQLEGTFDVHADGRVAEQPGSQLSAAERLVRGRIVEAIQHRLAVGESAAEAVRGFQSEAVFTFLNRLAALKMMEARALVLPCVSQGDQSQGFKEFSGLAPGLIELPDKGYRLYLECLFDEIGREVGVLFDRTDAASQLWPRRKALEAVLAKLNTPELAGVWAEDETIGWIYQYYNDPEERKQMREESSAPRNSRELAVRNQFFTPRYVVEFLTDNTLGRIWYEMTKGQTRLKDQCRYLVRRPNEIFLAEGQSPPDSPPEAEPSSQEDLLKQPVHIPHRPLKDPREIRMIDPACGSMHFGLYAFDLFTVIYDEAWEMAHGMDAAQHSTKSFAPFVTFAASFVHKEAFLREVPRLIVEHNIHGIDIDPRAAQIAGLALWLRAQRAWQALGLKSSDRPPIRRSNIVCAEPMPGEKELLREFVEQQFPQGERSLFQTFLENVWDKMRLAGEAGSLLKIEEEIRNAIEDAREAWRKLSARPMELFSATELNRISSAPELTGMDQAVSSLAAGRNQVGVDFWEHLEERIYNALRDYAKQAESEGGFQRRLFAEDAARGFAFIDVCRKRYDVVEMNPPFGEVPIHARDYIGESYIESKSDIGMAFVSCFTSKLNQLGRLGAITNRVFVANETLDTWRDDYLLGAKSSLNCLLDLGFGVLDGAKVEAAAFVIDRGTNQRFLSTFVRVLDARDKEAAATELLAGSGHVRGGFVFRHQLDSFHALPGHVLAYQLPLSLARRVTNGINLTALGGKAAVGLQPSDDFRFVRLAWEAPSGALGRSAVWSYYAKGGEYQPYWDDIHLVVNWANDGAEIRNFFDENGKIRSRPQNLQYYFRAGVTWPERTTSDFSPRALPEGCIFSVVGQGIFCGSVSKNLAYVAGAYSRAFKLIVDAVYGSGDASSPGSMATHYRSGVLAMLPPPIWDGAAEISDCALRLVGQAMRLFDGDETSRYFWGPATLKRSIREYVDLEIAEISARVTQMLEDHAVVDAKVLDELGFDENDRKTVDRLVGPHPVAYANAITKEDIAHVAELWQLSESDLIRTATSKHGARRQLTMKSYAASRRYELVAHALEVDARSVARIVTEHLFREPGMEAEIASRILSWLVGVAFGRWDVRVVTGERVAPGLPDPFAFLPVCSPGQLQNSQGLPNGPDDVPATYPINIPWDGILVDDEHHPMDVVARVVVALRVIWKERADDVQQEVCEILGVKSLCVWFRKATGFFSNHLTRYSKSRRQAPIYWPLSSPNGLYTVWLYYHRLTADTLFTVLRDYLKPKLEFEERRAFQLRQEAGTTPSPSQRRDIAEAEELVEDLRAFKAELERVAPLFRPNLNDGVIINYAPLWRMIGLPKWRKDCQAIWNELAQGDYDWAHLALHLWPERVVPKCATDRSLAIAHGLDEVFWQEDPQKPGKWIARKVTDLELRGLIAERTSAAVKAAVESLVGATSNEGTSRRGRKGAKA